LAGKFVTFLHELGLNFHVMEYLQPITAQGYIAPLYIQTRNVARWQCGWKWLTPTRLEFGSIHDYFFPVGSGA